MKNKKILLILSQFHPSVTPNVFRWQRICEEFVKQGNSITILTTKSTNTPNDYFSDDLRIIRTGHNTLMDLWQYYTSTKNKRSEYGSVNKKPSWIRSCLEFIINQTWRKIYWPDGTALWYFPAKSKIKNLFKEESFDVVISVGLPFTAHLLGKFCKLNSKRCIWIMDIEDPFCYSDEFWVNNFSLYKKLNIRKEKECFQFADHISVTNQSALDKYMEYFSFAKSKIEVIPPLLNEDHYDGDYKINLDPNECNLGYFGSFYLNVREPQRLVNFLKKVKNADPLFFSKLKIYIAGQLSPKHAYYFFNIEPEIKDKIVLIGFINQRDIHYLMKRMHSLINIGNTTSYHLPSKIVDYLASRRPIINLITTPKDSVKQMIGEKYFIHISEQASNEEIKKAINYMQTDIKNEFFHDIKLNEFIATSIAKKYMQMMG